MKNQFKKGDRVTTPQGAGTVAYTRNGGPDFTEVSAVSVVLDSKKNAPKYTGTIFLVDVVRRLLVDGIDFS